ncbi:MAG: AAA family ATPase, partial [Thermoflexales bacterium]
MRLKKVTLSGYKTFASRQAFEFGAGITAVIGPNGSGKSNVADGVRWALGEQSYSLLRGKRTDDMIYSGSTRRARASMAEVLLTFDNSDGFFPIEFSEIEIGRRAFRDGANEYLLNGNKVRLRDIGDLLSHTGLAERTYTVIGQGMVDDALAQKPEERRALFEEAAGIG